MNNKKLFKNQWVDNETRSLKTDLKCGKESDFTFYKMLAMTLLLLFLSINAFGDEVIINCSCPYCHRDIQIDSITSVRLFPDTWRCPNPKCKYENYDGINYCALCGTKRKS